MEIRINGKPAHTQCRRLMEVVREVQGSLEGLVVIYNGFQTDEDLPLSPGDEITLIRKGEMPSLEALEPMLSARHTPGVYEKIRQSRVAIAGLGGLGSHIALSLARTGVGCLHLIDFDIVEPSNLNRQQYRICHLGMAKAHALQQQIQEVNPFVQVIAENLRLTEQNAGDILRDDPIICEAFDVPESKAMLVDTILSTYPEKVIVAASGMAGYGSSNAIHTRKVAKNFYLCGDETTQAQPGCGLMAPRVSICAGHQANAVLRILLGEPDE